jgi:hypothetical protein
MIIWNNRHLSRKIKLYISALEGSFKKVIRAIPCGKEPPGQQLCRVVNQLKAPGGKEVSIIFGSFTLSLKIFNLMRRVPPGHAFD